MPPKKKAPEPKVEVAAVGKKRSGNSSGSGADEKAAANKGPTALAGKGAGVGRGAGRGTSGTAAYWEEAKQGRGRAGQAAVEHDGVWRPLSKKAVRANGGVVAGRPAREVGEWIVKEFQRLPRQLLNEHCQKQKLPKPRVERAASKPPRFTSRVVMPDPKNRSDKDLILCTNESFASVAESEEMAALLTLHHLMPKLPLEKKFPEPFADAWLSMNTDKPAVTRASEFVSVAAKVLHETKEKKEVKDIELKKHTVLKQYAPVFMSDSIRKFVEDIINTLKSMDATSGTVATHSPTSLTATVDETLVNELVALGFAEKDARLGSMEAARAATTGDDARNIAIDWLCLSLPEHRLPKKFSGRGGGFEVVLNQGRADGLTETLGNGRMGLPLHVCEAAIDKAGGKVEVALQSIFNELYQSIALTLNYNMPTEIPTADNEVTDELEALTSIYQSDISVTSSTPPYAFAIQLSSSTRDEPKKAPKKAAKKAADTSALPPLSGSLEVLIPSTNHYPHELPIFTLTNDKLSAQQRLHVVQCIGHRAFEQKLLGSAMIMELVSWLQSNWNTILVHDHYALPAHWTHGIKTHGLSSDQKAKLIAPASSPSAATSTAPSKSESSKKAGKSAAKKGETKTAWSDTKEESTSSRTIRDDTKLNETLYQQFMSKQSDPEYQQMISDRGGLPAAKEKKNIITLLEKNQVLVISGATGCGKSTQIPQFVLDSLLESKRGGTCNIICTQPRRISAVGLAERVSAERAEKCGQSVGYRIRGEAKVSQGTRLAYCTTGILLRQLTSPNGLDNVSHVIIDEVHERTVEIDFLMIILKETLKDRPNLKVILMSATLDAEVFASYFDGAPVISIPGRTFPVQEHFLEDMLELTGYEPQWTRNIPKNEDTKSKMEELKRLAGDRTYSEGVLQTVYNFDDDRTDLDLIEAMIWHIYEEMAPGGILVFLPGLYEITKLQNMIRSSIREYEMNPDDVMVVPLHGALSTANQTKVFKRAPKGVRKIVLATNIAETSITVNDVVYVIDSGKMKESQYDAERKMGLLVETWVSKANATQRKGRAGRVSSGQCFRLCSRPKWNTLPDHQLPEIRRTALDHVCLQIKLLKLDDKSGAGRGGVARVLNKAIQPPPEKTVTSALQSLRDLGAISDTEALTPLGIHLARLPVANVRIGKMLIYGAMFACVEPLVSIAALLSSRNPFVAPMDKRAEADAARLRLSVPKSDHLSLLKAFQGYMAAKQKGSKAAEKFCVDNFLSANTLREVESTVAQYISALADAGFIQSQRRGASGGMKSLACDDHNANASNQNVVTAILAAGLYPNVIEVRSPVVYAETAHGSILVAPEAKNIEHFIRAPVDELVNDEKKAMATSRVYLHPRSINSSTREYQSPWMVYLELVASGKVYVHDCTMVSPYSLLLFGGQIAVDHTQGLITVDEWIKFRSSGGKLAVLIRELRRHLDRTLVQKIDTPSLDISARSSPVIEAILRLLTTNGFDA